MNENEAIEKFFPMIDDTIFGKHFIRSLYGEGYLIVKPRAHMTKYNPEEEWIRIK